MIQQFINEQTMSGFVKTMFFCSVMVIMATGGECFKEKAFAPKYLMVFRRLDLHIVCSIGDLPQSMRSSLLSS